MLQASTQMNRPLYVSLIMAQSTYQVEMRTQVGANFLRTFPDAQISTNQFLRQTRHARTERATSSIPTGFLGPLCGGKPMFDGQ